MAMRHIAIFSFLISGLAFAQPQPDEPGRGVARLSIINGDVSVRRGDSGDWVAATTNAPVVVQDSLATGPNGLAEVQFDSANMLRIGRDSEVNFSNLDYGRGQVQIARGTVTFRVLRQSQAQMEIDTPTVAVRPLREGAYRITVRDDGQTEITVRSGQAEIYTPRGAEQLNPGQTMLARGNPQDPEFQNMSAIPMDSWDQWNDQRDQQLLSTQSYRYVSPEINGAEDLDHYGQWENVPEYGNVWSPSVTDPNWAPYRDGRWSWEDWYGWTWVGYEPWGWAPYHYGRWFQYRNRWCWYPGVRYSHHYWSPGLVAFFGWGNGGVGLSFGNVGWVPLAPYEVYHPWYGRGVYGGYRGGFYNHVNIASANVYSNYRNARVYNGVTGVRAGDFAAGRRNFSPVPVSNLHQAGLVRGGLPVTPERGALRFSDRQGAAPRFAGANQHFYSRMQPAQVNRVPFDQQRQAIGGSGRSWSGFSRSTATPSAPQAQSMPRGAMPRNDRPGFSQQAPAQNQGGWRRFGQPGGPTAQVQDSGRSRNFSSYQGGPAAPQSRAAQPQDSGRNQRFGGSSSPNYSRGAANSQARQFQVAPPVVRERPSMNNNAQPRSDRPAYSAPQQRYNAPAPQQRYSAPAAQPRYSRPSYSAPQRSERPSNSGGGRSYSAPAQRSAPAPQSHGGGGGGGSRGGDSHGGGRRR